MDGWMVDGWIDGWMMDGWIDDGWMVDGWMDDGWMDDGWMDDGWMMDGWMDDGWMDGRMMDGSMDFTDGSMDFTDGWMNGWMFIIFYGWINGFHGCPVTKCGRSFKILICSCLTWWLRRQKYVSRHAATAHVVTGSPLPVVIYWSVFAQPGSAHVAFRIACVTLTAARVVLGGGTPDCQALP